MLINKVVSNKSNLILYILMALVTILVACQPVETSTPVTITQYISTATMIVPTPTAPTPIIPTMAVTATTTLIPSATPLSTPITPYPEEWLAFVDQKTWEPNPAIHTLISFIRQDGSGLFQPNLFESFESTVKYSLVWSPDGKYLLFDWDGNPMLGRGSEIYLVNLSEGIVTASTFEDDEYSSGYGIPTWAPDRHSFVATLLTTTLNQDGEAYYVRNLFTIDAHTLQRNRLTTSLTRDLYPSWSPSGQWIAFLRYDPDAYKPAPEHGVARCPAIPDNLMGCNNANLYLIRQDESDLRLLLESVFVQADWNRDFPYNAPAWSPDSQWLAVLTGSEQPDITLINIESGETRVLAADPAPDIYPTWSPNGNKLAFVSSREGNEEIYLISADGTGMVNLTNNPGIDFNPVWSPSGRYIAFLSTRDGLSALYVMNADGSNQTKIHDGLIYTRPSWFPLIKVDLRTFFYSENR